MTSLYMALFVLLFCIGLFYIYQYIQEGFGRGGRGMGMGGRGMGRPGMGMRRGGWGMGGPRRHIFYYPTYFQDYDTPDVYIYPVQTSYATGFNDYLRWLFGYR